MILSCFALKHCQEHVEQKQNDLEQSRVTLEWKGVNIRKSEAKDDKIVKAVKEIKKARVKILKNKEQREDDRFVMTQKNS